MKELGVHQFAQGGFVGSNVSGGKPGIGGVSIGTIIIQNASGLDEDKLAKKIIERAQEKLFNDQYR
jgi:hypothetical protein